MTATTKYYVQVSSYQIRGSLAVTLATEWKVRHRAATWFHLKQWKKKNFMSSKGNEKIDNCNKQINSENKSYAPFISIKDDFLDFARHGLQVNHAKNV